MRTAFIKILSRLAAEDEKIILLVGDVGFSFIEQFAADYPKQYLNVGVTEQSMMGIAAGLALSGYKPYVYSMIPFVTMRCFEQLRNDVCYNHVPVTVVGVKGSEHYKFLGFSHNITDDEDFRILSVLPNLDLFEPKTGEDLEDVMLNRDLNPAFKGRASYIRL